MPDRKKHGLSMRLLLGKEFPQVDSWMDAPAKQLGPRHRRLRHNILDIALRFNPITQPEEFLAALTHIGLDSGTSALRRAINERKKKAERKRRRPKGRPRYARM